MDSLLIHVCCGPCSTVPLARLSVEGMSFAAFFSNSNIDSKEEYELRFENFRCFAAGLGVTMRESPYEPDSWRKAIGPRGGLFPVIPGSPDHDENLASRQARCRACYAYRFERLASEAQSGGYGRISTTLSISPYQFTEIMEDEIRRAADRYGVESAFVDYRPLYQKAVMKSRELGMYRQKYCGCAYSLAEAELERKARKAAQKIGSHSVQGDAHE